LRIPLGALLEQVKLPAQIIHGRLVGFPLAVQLRSQIRNLSIQPGEPKRNKRKEKNPSC
jgi:hypothetical protein